MAIEPITTTGPTITVSSEAELTNAYDTLSTTEGGGTILLEPGFYGSFGIYTYGSTLEEQPVVIKSADATDPAEFSGLYIREVSNLRIENIFLDGSDDLNSRDEFDVTIQNVDNVQIVDSVFVQDLDNSIKEAGEITDSGVWIRDSNNVLFEGNYLNGQYNALQVQNVTDTDIIGNEITNILGDGFRGGGLQNVNISDNYMHDFYVLNQNQTHTDMIQVWGVNTYILTENLTVSGNILVASDGGTQGIFIRNEEFGKDSDPTSGYFQNIRVTDNLIYNGHLHGIRIDDADGVTVDGNTVLWNPDAGQEWGADYFIWEPVIRLENSNNTEVKNNIASGLDLLDSTVAYNNEIITYGDSEDLSYVGNHFANPLVGADVVLADLELLPTSSFLGVVGSSIGSPSSDVSDGAIGHITASADESDLYQITFDASGSTDMNGASLSGAGYSYHWTFADGTTAEGLTVIRNYEEGGYKGVELDIRLNEEVVASITRNVAVKTKDLFAFDFEDGVVDISAGVPVFVDNGSTVVSTDGMGFLIGDGSKLEIDRKTIDAYDLDTFGLALDLTPVGDEQSGVFLHLHQSMEGRITEDGYVEFWLGTDEGSYSLRSTEPIFDDGATHRIGIAFNGQTGQLEMFADGESVSQTEAWGTTSEPVYWNIVFGNTWNDSIDAIIDNVEMSKDPAVAGDLPDIAPPQDPPVEDPPADDPPAEDPPAEDPPAEDPPSDESVELTLTLIDTTTDEEIMTLMSGDELPLDILGNADVSVVVNVSQDVGSIRLTLGDYVQVENAEPYALFGDVSGDVSGAESAPFDTTGDYTLGVELFSGANATGDLLGEADYELRLSEYDITPPAEDPPAEDPPAEEPPAEDPGGRGDEPEPVASDGGSDFFLAELLDIILSLFGLGSDDDPRPVSTVETTESAEVMLSDVLPVTEALDEDMPIEEDEETEIDLAA